MLESLDLSITSLRNTSMQRGARIERRTITPFTGVRESVV